MIPVALVPMALRGLNMMGDFVSYWRNKKGGNRAEAMDALKRLREGANLNLPPNIAKVANIACSAMVSCEGLGLAADEMSELIAQAEAAGTPVTIDMLTAYVEESNELLADFDAGTYEAEYNRRHGISND